MFRVKECSSLTLKVCSTLGSCETFLGLKARGWEEVNFFSGRDILSSSKRFLDLAPAGLKLMP
jgi:hypothetical protein